MHTMLLVRTHIGISLSFCIFKKKKKKSVPPCTLDRLIVVVSVAKHIRIVSLPGRFISSFLFFFVFSFPFFFFFFFFFFQSGVGLFTNSEPGMTRHIFLCICYIICCLEISICCTSHPTQAGPSFAEEESPCPTPVGPVRYGRRDCL